MKAADLQALLAAAIAEKLLPASAVAPAAEAPRPWPVVVLTALGAWLAAVPLLGVVQLLLGDLVARSGGPYVVGVLLIGGAVVVLRSASVALFVEQLAVPALLVGGGTLGFGLFRDLPYQMAAALLAGVALALGAVVHGAWLRVLSGALAAMLLALALTRETSNRLDSLIGWWWSWHIALGVVLAALAGLRATASARVAAVGEALCVGWLLATIVGLAGWSGMTFLVGASAGGGFAGEVARAAGRRGLDFAQWSLPQAISAALAAAAAAWSTRKWPGLRQPWLAGVALVFIALAWFMATLGATALALAVCASTHRWRLAASAALAAAWIIGAFYYQLDWPLGTKAVVLAGAGASLGALAWAGRAPAVAPGGSPQVRRGAAPTPALARLATVGIAATVVLVLATAHIGIRRNEALIRDGRPVFVELAPVDPRSLMQGDFMRLNFRVPAEPSDATDALRWARRPQVVARVDERGVATLRRIDTGAPLADGELRIELTPKNGRWTLVTDAWFFAEGQAARFERAKFAEFRVEPSGRALLVGLRGANLEAL